MGHAFDWILDLLQETRLTKGAQKGLIGAAGLNYATMAKYVRGPKKWNLNHDEVAAPATGRSLNSNLSRFQRYSSSSSSERVSLAWKQCWTKPRVCVYTLRSHTQLVPYVSCYISQFIQYGVESRSPAEGDAFAFNYHMTRRYSWC